MSADVEAATANPTTVDSKAEDFKAPDTAAEDGSENASNDDGDDDDRRAKKYENGAGRELDDKYSKHRSDGYKSKRNGSFSGNARGNNSRIKRTKFDRSNVKSRYDDQERTDDPFQIRKQVEFYFSDGNLHQDKFLFEQIGGSDNRPVDIKVIASFKRMQRFEPYSAIVAALKESTTLDVVNEDKPNDEQIRRKTPLLDNFGKSHEEVKANYDSESMKRSIYAKGFGSETSKTQIDVENFFAPYLASTVRLRRANDGTFKGSVFVEFESEEDMKQFLDLEDKPEWEGKQLDIKTKAEYCKEKDKLINEGKIRRNDLDEEDGRRGSWRGGRGGHRGRDRGGRRYNDRRGDRSRSRSRSRSRGRGERFQNDLKSKNWREVADEEDREREAKRQKRDEPKQEYDEAGIPKIKSTPKKDSDAATNGKKRSLEDDGEKDGGEVKKVKSGDE